MCTFVLAHRVFDDVPLCALGNRDERLERPASSWAPRTFMGRHLFAPRDESAGGTWVALALDPLMVAALTNRFTGQPPDTTRPSRGQLPLLAAASPGAAAAAQLLLGLPQLQNPYHLIVADARHAFLVASDGARTWSRTLAPGFHVITERSDGSEPQPRIDRLRSMLPPAGSRLDLRGLFPLLTIHAAEPVEGTCVHLPELGYGTRSTFAFAGPNTLFTSDAPSCQVPLARSTLLEAPG
jgi:hypothetical protein